MRGAGAVAGFTETHGMGCIPLPLKNSQRSSLTLLR